MVVEATEHSIREEIVRNVNRTFRVPITRSTRAHICIICNVEPEKR